MVLNWIGELAWPPAGGVTDCGSVTPMPVGVLPTQETENVTGELKLPFELTRTLVPALIPGIVETVSVAGFIAKSPGRYRGAAGATGAKTVGAPPIATDI